MARPQDIGTQFISDAAQGAVQDPAAGRSLSDQKSAPTPVRPFPTAFGLANANPTILTSIQMVITGVFGDTLSCRTYDDAGNLGLTNIIVAKPYHLRPSVYEVDNSKLKIEETSASTRTVTRINGSLEAITTEQISPPYVATTLTGTAVDSLGDVIQVGLSNSNSQAGTNGLIDLNIVGRRFENSVFPLKQYFVITAVNKDTFSCHKWDAQNKIPVYNDPNDLSNVILIAKPDSLRGTTWSGQTIGGVSYVDSSSDTDYQTRQGTNVVTEDQEVTPPWFDDVTVIKAEFIETGTGAVNSGVQAMWQDVNDGGHAFAEKFQ